MASRIDRVAIGPGSVRYRGRTIRYPGIEIRRPAFPHTVRLANGGGKSTLALLLAGVIPDVIHAAVEVSFSVDTRSGSYSGRELREHGLLAVVPQRSEMGLLGYDVRTELELAARDRPLAETVDRFELLPLLGRDQARLSDGERKRLTIAVSLLADPALLICDEWRTHLDAKWQSLAEERLETYDKNDGCRLNFDVPNDRTSQDEGTRQRRDQGRRAAQEVALACDSNVDCPSQDGIALVQSPYIAGKRAAVPWRTGTVTVIRGPNGSGKSTILRRLALRGRLWRVLRRGLPTTNYVGSDARYGFIGPQVINHLKAALGARSKHLDPVAALVSEHSSVSSTSDVYELSFGQAKLLGLASALFGTSPFVLLDEPYAGADAFSASAITVLIASAARSGKVVVISELTGEEPFSYEGITTCRISIGDA